MPHRGPDGLTLWCEPPPSNSSGDGIAVSRAALGHAALHTTPEDRHTQQPIAHANARLVLTGDLRLDNRSRLARKLSQPPSSSDASLALAAFERWGENAATRLRGDFAIAVFDRANRRLICVRDPMGVRPLYVAQHGDDLVLASEIKAILATGIIEPSVDPEFVAQYLTRTMTGTSGTGYLGIDRVAPGHVLVADDRGVRTTRYWDPSTITGIDGRTDADYMEGFRHFFRRAVRTRLRTSASDQLGVSLSGGLDSSSVTCTARDLLKEQGRAPLRTYSATFPSIDGPLQAFVDERPYLDAIESGGHVRSRRLSLAAERPLSASQAALAANGQPCFTYNAYLMQAIQDAARDDGVRVLLDGIEGDLAVSHGDGYIVECARRGDWNKAIHLIREMADRNRLILPKVATRIGGSLLEMDAQRGRWRSAWTGSRALAPVAETSRLRLLWRHAAKPLLPETVRMQWNRLRGVSEDTPRLARLLADTIRSQTTLDEQVLQDEHEAATLSTEREMHAYVLTNGIAARFLEEGNHFAAQRGIELRHPFYDTQLLEYCISLPPDLKMRSGWTRYVLREAMRGVLPEKIRTRTGKATLRPNFARNLTGDADSLDQLFSPEATDRLAPYLDLSTLSEARDADDAEILWMAFQLNQWLASVDAQRDTTPSVERNQPQRIVQASRPDLR